MLAEIPVGEYLQEIRDQVCSRCIERPPGGPPCAPLGKQCGVELHLPQLIESIRHVHSPLVTPYLEHNREEICEQCAFLHSSICPCPMDYLLTLIVEAVEAVDERHGTKPAEIVAPSPGEVSLEEVERVYQDARGTWTGCDWTTHFGIQGVNLQDLRSWDARAIAMGAAGSEKGEMWTKAAKWLTNVESYAARAENEAASAVAAAKAGDWHHAVRHAQRAWALEFATGRPLRSDRRDTWLKLALLIDEAAGAQRAIEEGSGD